MTSAGFEGRSPRRRAETLASAPFCRFWPLRAKNSPALTALWPLKRTHCHQWTLALWQFYSGAWQSKSRFYTAQDYLEGKEKRWGVVPEIWRRKSCCHEEIHNKQHACNCNALHRISSQPKHLQAHMLSKPWCPAGPVTSAHMCSCSYT